MKAMALKVAAQNPKYIFMTNYASLGSQFIKQYLSLGKPKPIFVFDLTLNHVIGDYEKMLGNLKVLDGSVVVSTLPEGGLADYGYDALAILVATEKGQGSWLDRIQGLKLKGVTGDISFDPAGRRIPTISITSITNGKIPSGK